MSKDTTVLVQKQKSVLVGEVISDKMDKTIVVRVVRTLKHPQFGKVLKRKKNFKVHDQNEEAGVGDQVVQIHQDLEQQELLIPEVEEVDQVVMEHILQVEQPEVQV